MHERLVDLFELRGWNLYCIDEGEILSGTVAKGSGCLKQGKEYFVLPSVADPRDVKTVQEVLDNLTPEEFPIVIYGRERIPLISFQLEEDKFKVVKGKKSLKFTYEQFFRIVDTLPDRLLN